MYIAPEFQRLHKTFKIYNKLYYKSTQILNVPNRMCYATNYTHENMKQPLRLINYQKDLHKQNMLKAEQHF